ncbi:MAG: sigma-70 family RNA polymerase sigma factor [Planctomycetota bacterium]|nr:sigma-70 family RNA polymerase sigma factor [Planctomycetota bacterium]
MSQESQLIELALRGDHAAFTTLVELNQDRLFASMLQVTGSPEEAEEVVQDAFIRAFIKLNTFQGNSQFFTWLYRIAFNSALSRRRRYRSKVSLDQLRDHAGTEIVGEQPSVDEPLLQGERIAIVQQALQELSEDHRAILVLREMEGFSYEQIAEIAGISIGTVRSRLSRARAHLKNIIEANSEDPLN